MTPLLACKLVLTTLFWGGTFIAGRVLAQTMPLMSAAFGRFVVAAVLLLVLLYRFEGGWPRLTRRQWLQTALLGLTGIFLYNLFFFAALAHLPAGRTALFVSLNPAVTALMASVLLRERLGARRWLGIAIALCGTLVVVSRGDVLAAWQDVRSAFGRGEVLIMGAMLSWVAYTLLSRPVLATLSPLAATTCATLWGLLFLGVGAFAELGEVRWQALGWHEWLAMLYLGACGTVLAFIWYYEGIRAVGASRTIIFTNLVPVFAVALSALLLNEAVLPSMVVGGLLTMIGVLLVSRK